jgi:hypothetical protein
MPSTRRHHRQNKARAPVIGFAGLVARQRKARAATDIDLSGVVAGHSRSKNGVASLAYVPVIHLLRHARKETALKQQANTPFRFHRNGDGMVFPHERRRPRNIRPIFNSVI